MTFKEGTSPELAAFEVARELTVIDHEERQKILERISSEISEGEIRISELKSGSRDYMIEWLNVRHMKRLKELLSS